MASDSLSRRLVLRRVIRAADAVIALTPKEASWQRAHLGVLSDRQHIIPNGVDESVFAPAPSLAVPAAPWRLLYVGQLIQPKGVHVLLEACARLASHHPLSLHLAYHVDHDLRRLRKQADALGLQVEFLGMQTPEQLARLYAASHIVILPSLSEALPSVISEAMMVGRPIVATDVGGIRDQLAGRGCLVKPGDIASLTTGIAEMLKHYPKWSHQAGEMSTIARERFAMSTMVARHADLYQELLDRPRPTRPPIAGAAIRAGTRAAVRIRGRTRDISWIVGEHSSCAEAPGPEVDERFMPIHRTPWSAGASLRPG